MTPSRLVALSAVLLCLSLSACAAPPPQTRPAPAGDARAETPVAKCDATRLAWALGQVADDALVERARTGAGALSVRVLRPGMMVTNDFSATRLNIRVDNARKVLATSCG